MESALDPVLAEAAVASWRLGVGRSGRKPWIRWTTLLLVRFRYHILTTIGEGTRPLLAEDCQLLGFSGAPDAPTWLTREAAEALLAAEPDENIADAVARSFRPAMCVDNLGLIQDEARMTTAKEARPASCSPLISGSARLVIGGGVK